MAYCLTFQPPGFNGPNLHAFTSSYQHNYSPCSTNTSSHAIEYLDLFPDLSNTTSSGWSSPNTTPLWLQYLSKLCSSPLKSSSSSSEHSPCAVLRIQPPGFALSTTKSQSTIFQSKRSSFKRTSSRFNRIHKHQ